MATKSMHKPGWRSRRRSRLSLVERAVPRLGRAPEHADAAKADEREARSRGLEERLDTGAAPDAGSMLPESAPEKVAAADPTAESEASPESATAETGGTSTADRPMLADESPGADESPVADVDPDTDIASEADSGPRTDGDRDDDARMRVQDDDRSAAEEIRDDAGDEAEAAGEHQDTSAPESEGTDQLSDRSEKPGAAVRAAEAAGSLPDQASVAAALGSLPAASPPSATPTFALDWVRLIDEGFTDPREGDRRLSPNMKAMVRALIRQALSDQSSWRDRIVLVTSPNERAAKTAASINFAFGLATAAEHRVVLVDVDTGGPGAVTRLGAAEGETDGICEALADEELDVADLMIPTDLERLTLVASGTPDEGTFDRFASRRMLQILRFMTRDPAALLIIDAPPILKSQEAAVLSVIAGQVVLAVEAGRTTADSIEHALQRIGDRHNVSIALTENSGFGRENEGPSRTVKDDETAPVNRRAPGVGRPVPKVAAAALGAVLIGLLAWHSDAFAAAATVSAEDRTVPFTSAGRCPNSLPSAVAGARQGMGR